MSYYACLSIMSCSTVHYTNHRHNCSTLFSVVNLPIRWRYLEWLSKSHCRVHEAALQFVHRTYAFTSSTSNAAGITQCNVMTNRQHAAHGQILSGSRVRDVACMQPCGTAIHEHFTTTQQSYKHHFTAIIRVNLC